MKPAADTLEGRIRERAYHIWEANGRPAGRDKEFWHQACELIGTDQAKPKVQRRQSTRAQPAQTARTRSRKASARVSPD